MDMRTIEDLYQYHQQQAPVQAANALDLEFKLRRIETLYWVSINTFYNPEYLNIIAGKEMKCQS